MPGPSPRTRSGAGMTENKNFVIPVPTPRHSGKCAAFIRNLGEIIAALQRNQITWVTASLLFDWMPDQARHDGCGFAKIYYLVDRIIPGIYCLNASSLMHVIHSHIRVFTCIHAVRMPGPEPEWRIRGPVKQLRRSRTRQTKMNTPSLVYISIRASLRSRHSRVGGNPGHAQGT